VARGQATYLQAENLASPLERIKGVSKELVSVMSDIVWAINPTKDTLPDLIQRMRRFGSDVLSGQGVRFDLRAPEVENDFQLGANIRREIFAIFKESVNNTVKYAGATAVEVDFQIRENTLFLKIEDNGNGFNPAEILSEDFKPEMGGNGLVNMRRRAADLGGTCQITSAIDQGTRIELQVPLHHSENSWSK
jgi:signal transduction histidine kinase